MNRRPPLLLLLLLLQLLLLLLRFWGLRRSRSEEVTSQSNLEHTSNPPLRVMSTLII